MNDDAVMDLGMEFGSACAPAFVMLTHDLPADERIELIRTFLCCISGMAEQSIGHGATRELFAFVAQLGPAAARTTPLQ